MAELDIINHSIKYSLAKIRAVISPNSYDIREKWQKQDEGKILGYFDVLFSIKTKIFFKHIVAAMALQKM